MEDVEMPMDFMLLLDGIQLLVHWMCYNYLTNQESDVQTLET